MARLRLTLACGDYDRTRALADGRVPVEGVDLNYLPLEIEETLARMVQFEEFDAAELGMNIYVAQRSRGDERFVALPVFPSRSFRHNAIYVHSGAGIERPEQLRGRRVGVPAYTVTAVVWVRAALQHEYGVYPHELHWYQGGLHDPGRREAVRGWTPPPGVAVEPLPEGRTLNEMLVAGDLDAVISPRLPNAFLAGAPQVRRLFPNYAEVERDWYRRTGIFPIMHTIVLKRAVYEANPWVAASLFKAFVEAKERCERAIYNTAALPVMLPWLSDHIEQTRAVMGTDWWAYGLEPNRVGLEAFVQYCLEQGVIATAPPVETLFPASTLAGVKV